jgi:uncharacterized protein (DUF433 family)
MELLDLELPDCLERWADGSIHVSGHRITLNHVVEFMQEDTAFDALHSRFPSIPVTKLQSVWEFCLAHLTELRQSHESMRQEVEEIRGSMGEVGLDRDELLRRMEERLRQKRSN